MDTIVASHSAPPGSTRHNHSPWLFEDAAHILIRTAKERVYLGKIDNADHSSTSNELPDSLKPILEEQPKWGVLSEVMDEIEQDGYFNPVKRDESNNTILIMCGDRRTCRQIRDYLETKHIKVQKPNEDESDDPTGATGAEDGPSAELMMRRKLREYLSWKQGFAKVNDNLFGYKTQSKNSRETRSNALSGRPNVFQGKAPSNKRRRIRGGGTAASTAGRAPDSSVKPNIEQPGQVSNFLEEIQPTVAEEGQKEEGPVDDLHDMEDFYELYDMDDLIMVHPYGGDMDDHILEEARPRYIIMYEPDAAFIRRVEVYRSSHTDRNVKVYFMYYSGSVEEQRYLSVVRREKDAFTKLIKEKGVRRNQKRFLIVE